MVQLDALLQASGEAKYTSDLHVPNMQHGKLVSGVEASMTGGGIATVERASGRGAVPPGTTLYGAFVSTSGGSSSCVLAAIDTREAEKCPGYVCLVTAVDFPNAAANRNAGAVTNTTPSYLLEIGDTVPCAHAHAALVLADTPAHARYAAKHVRLVLSPSPGPPPSAPLLMKRELTHAQFDECVESMYREGLAQQMRLPVAALSKATAAGKAVAAQAAGALQAQQAGVTKAGGGWKTEGASAVGGEAMVKGAADAGDDVGSIEHWGVVIGRPAREWSSSALEDGGQVIKGQFVAGAQKHFFLETQVGFCLHGRAALLPPPPLPSGFHSLPCAFFRPHWRSLKRMADVWCGVAAKTRGGRRSRSP